MQLSNNWTAAGQSQLEPYYIQHILNIERTDHVSGQQYKEFESHIHDIALAHDCVDKDLLYFQNQLNQFKIKIAGKQFSLTQFEELNTILTFLGIKKRVLQSVLDGNLMFFYVSLKTLSTMNNAYLIQEEHVRFPTVAPSLAAINFNDQIYLRKECFDVIYEYKWKMYEYGDNSFGGYSFFSEEDKISESFKKTAVNLIQESQTDIDFKKYMQKCIIENVYYHEIGHLAEYKKINEEALALCVNANKMDLSSLYNIFEVLADISGCNQKKKGTLANILVVSEKNIKRADQLFYIYLSDTWFFDTSDTYMYEYSLFIHMIMGSCIKPDLSIDYQKLKSLIDPGNIMSIYTQLCGLINTTFNQFRDYFLQEKYVIGLELHTFASFKSHIDKTLSDNFKILDKQTFKYYSKFWSSFLNLVNRAYLKNNKLPTLKKNSQDTVYELFSKVCFGQELTKELCQKRVIEIYKKCGLC
ncbi:hypothetical protein DID76_03690 [Candidatus Marinamargulisbacteria bacterium SCGC AG-414-C22]|nr:hypothetical protein DID76_03690 [Candidatus Marinamargulisbacteria bacterium SCGC AG-414-C22]